MDRLRRTLSFRLKKKDNSLNKTTLSDDTSIKIAKEKTTKWPDDERAVRVGLCKFRVKVRRSSMSFLSPTTCHRFRSIQYLGNIDVQDSRGISLCEQAIQALINVF